MFVFLSFSHRSPKWQPAPLFRPPTPATAAAAGGHGRGRCGHDEQRAVRGEGVGTGGKDGPSVYVIILWVVISCLCP